MAAKGKASRNVWIGRVMSVLAVAPFLMSAAMKLSHSPQMLQGWTHFGWTEDKLTLVAVLELGSVALYLIPQIAVFGAIILTGYLGGAMSTHIRIGDPVYMHLVIGFLIWGGLYLREPRLKPLLPIRK